MAVNLGLQKMCHLLTGNPRILRTKGNLDIIYVALGENELY